MGQMVEKEREEHFRQKEQHKQKHRVMKQHRLGGTGPGGGREGDGTGYLSRGPRRPLLANWEPLPRTRTL